MEKEFSIDELSSLVGGEVIGEGSKVIRGFGPLDGAGENDLSFLASAANIGMMETSSAGAVLVPVDVTDSRKTVIRVKNPYLAAAIIQNHMLRQEFRAAGIHESAVVGRGCSLPEEITVGANAVIGDRVSIGSRVMIGPGAVIGDDVKIGDDCVIRANVTIEHQCEVGSRTIIHAGSVIGSDGYGYAADEQGCHIKRPQLGIVRIGDDVEIGANCCIDRATFGVTLVSSGTKIDNLVQIGHNVEMGENCLLVAQVGLAGSVKLGRNVVFGGKAGAAGHQTIGDGTMVAGKAAVHGDHPPGSMLAGTPAIPAKQWFKAAALFGKLPEIVKDIRRLKKEISNLSEKISK